MSKRFKLLGLADMIITEDVMDDKFSEVFPSSERKYLRWKKVDSKKKLQDINIKVEKNGPTAAEPPEGSIETIKTFDPEILVTQFPTIPPKVISAGKSLKIIGVLRGGTENVDIEKATEENVLVFNTVGRTKTAVSEFTIGMILAEVKNIARGHKALKDGRWRTRYPNGDFAIELPDRKVGVVGLGHIGREVTRKLTEGFDADVLAYDPFVSKEEMEEHNATKVTLEELCKKSNIVTVHARLSPETEGLIGEEELSLMKSNIYLINTARAGLIDKEALYKALRDKKIGGAALDVFWDEPLDPSSEFLDLDNLTITPHYAGSTSDMFRNTPYLLAKELEEFFETGTLDYILNPEVIENNPKKEYQF